MVGIQTPVLLKTEVSRLKAYPKGAGYFLAPTRVEGWGDC